MPEPKQQELTDEVNPEAKPVPKPLPVKVAKKVPLPPPKIYYDIRIETLLPATLIFKVLAENPEQAYQLSKTMQPTGVKHRLIGRRDLKVLVFDAYSTVIRYVKNLGR